MARASGQMTALLGLLAIAGYQNRDKIKEMLSGFGQPAQGGNQTGQRTGDLQTAAGGGITGGLGGLADLIGGSSVGGILSRGLGGLLDQFQQRGYGEKAQSWVQTGPNAEINDQQLAEALGPEVLNDLSARTGFSHEELLSRLSRELPKAVDGLTPEGRMPAEGQNEQPGNP